MTTGTAVISRAKEIRQRLMNPPNKVVDRGINLRQSRINQIKDGDVIAKAANGVAIVKVTEGFVVRREPEIIPKPIIAKKRAAILLKIVSRYFGVPEYQIVGRDRRPRIAYCRQVFAFMMRHKLKETYPSVGRFLKQDHTTCLHAHRKILRLMETTEETREHVQNIDKIYDADLFLYTVSPEYKSAMANVACQEESVPECGIQDVVGGGQLALDVAEAEPAELAHSG